MSRFLSFVVLFCLFSFPMLANAQQKVVFFTTDSFLQGKYDMIVQAAKEVGVTVNQFNVERTDVKVLASAAEQSDLLLYEVMGSNDQSKMSQVLNSISKSLPQKRMELRYISHQGSGIPADQQEQIWLYFKNAGYENMRRMFTYIDAKIFDNADANVLPYVEFPEYGLYHPKRPTHVFKTASEYLEWYQTEYPKTQGKPVIGLMFHHAMLGSMDTDHLNEAIRLVEDRGAIALPFYVQLNKVGSLKAAMDKGNNRPYYDVLIAFTSMNHKQNRQQYEDFGAPVMLGMTWRAGDTQDWRENPVGLNPALMPFYYVPKEYAGLTDNLMVSAVENGRTTSIPEQMESMINKALNLTQLQYKANANKKIALMYWNYPPGEKNMAASFMNIPLSMQQIEQVMANEGYQVTPSSEQGLIDAVGEIQRPFYRDNALEPLLATDKAELMPMADYKNWFARLPQKIREEVTFRWGQPEESPMHIIKDGQSYFVIPRIMNGNLMTLPQPPRGRRGEDAEKSIYHDMRLPLNHYYMAVYLYVREHFKADALIHLGTHGSQEWLPGKEQSLSVHDYPLIPLGDIPVLYPYSVDVVGEGTQAKRRGRATLISYQTPAFTPAGLHEGLQPIHDLVHEYQLLDDGAVKAQTENNLISVTGDDIMGDLGLDAAAAKQDFPVFLQKVHDYLHAIAKHTQPIGLHTFGTNPKPEERVLTVMQILGEAYYAELGIDDTSELFAVEYSKIKQSLPYRYLADVLIDQKPIPTEASEVMVSMLERAKQHYDDLSQTRELANLIKGLNGRYIETSIGGDPIRMPDASPTGRNFYSFDPQKVPTQSAWESGKKALNELIAAHKKAEGKFPQKLAFTMWSGETMRHLGMMEAQILYALGVQPIWDKGGKVEGVELISREELGRPRIDIMVSAAGLYRDHFPNVMVHIANAVALVAEEQEADNVVRQHAQELLKALQAKGFSGKQASNMAVTRIFSQEQGNYGVNLEDATLASDTWEDESKLYDLFLKPMQHAYGPNQDEWGDKHAKVNLFAEQLKGVDATVFSRSSNLYGFLNSACPFEYVGGLNLAARAVNGESPQLYISDMTNPTETKLTTGESYLAMELQTRYFHPGWLKSMQAEGYSGAVELLKGVNNFWGWNVMDPSMVRADQWQEFHEVYIKDKYELDMKQWFEESNPTAMAQIAERMLEAIRKDYWEASEQTKKELVQVYQELAEKYDVHTDNQTFKAYVAELSAGYGLSAAAAPDAAASAAEPAAMQAPEQPESSEATEPTETLETVQGQKMQQQQPNEQDPIDQPKWWLLLLAFLAAGALRQIYLRR
ncbi:cobaltochelatase subunit CobN [Thiosulfatimonas sediminis]|uniref:Cobaltochelatase subunit CobN n=1 Tax=Thiosulfatimonas sediminis TaxID=2675054 RepID=A0A6F8PYF6_9GAMM|nr:cobaltochelatase subunit CobN [Thiosulfatimonas sediminis]BBP47028.1 cobaltochelatase subunit CobN [Thiosulfatimonas sediminis]